jgi:excisionase family DNA binding protein
MVSFVRVDATNGNKSTFGEAVNLSPNGFNFKQLLTMEQEVINELEKIKQLTLLSVKEALTMNEAALFTGLSKSHIYKLCMNKKIPFYKGDGGKLSFFSKEELTQWMLQNRVSTSSEIEAQAVNYCVTGKRGGK